MVEEEEEEEKEEKQEEEEEAEEGKGDSKAKQQRSRFANEILLGFREFFAMPICILSFSDHNWKVLLAVGLGP